MCFRPNFFFRLKRWLEILLLTLYFPCLKNVVIASPVHTHLLISPCYIFLSAYGHFHSKILPAFYFAMIYLLLTFRYAKILLLTLLYVPKECCDSMPSALWAFNFTMLTYFFQHMVSFIQRFTSLLLVVDLPLCYYFVANSTLHVEIMLACPVHSELLISRLHISFSICLL